MARQLSFLSSLMTRFLFLALLASSCASTVQAQDLSLEKITSLASLPATLTAARNHEAELGDWVFNPSTPTAQEPLTWGWWPPADASGGPATALLSLRPNHGSLDVVLHLRRASSFSRLRRELLHQKAVPEAVTCLGCSGERFTIPGYSIAFYQGKPEPYPYIVVLHHGPEQAAESQPATGRVSASRIP